MEDSNGMEQGIAIVGMSARFPQAPDLATIWQQLRSGHEAITFFSEEELAMLDGAPHPHDNPHYVPASGMLADIEYFDADFFGYLPNEAATMDPQHRLFLECAWEALEHAGYTPEHYRGTIGVYAGTAASSYLLHHLLPNHSSLQQGAAPSGSYFSLAIGNDKDYLSTRVSYKLNLQGPSISVSTACSTSLVAVHLACQSLLVGECDMALAGGVSIHLPQQGYIYQDGGILSPDGHCRPFDARARGTVGGNGLGIVVLKRLTDALADRDMIHAVILSSAINNDGTAKVGYTAPAVEGQTRVITEALHLAEVTADTITYIEAHGTGTTLGDPIEIKALTQAFRADTQGKNYCAIGSIKANIGHLDAAAGIAGLIKVVLALHHKEIPPAVNYEQPNPNIDFANSPFYVNTELQTWVSQQTPCRAGVSSFGIGGTNAHLILEEAPQSTPSSPSLRPFLLTLSAKTPTALERLKVRLADYLDHVPDSDMADLTYTLQVGRKSFEWRWTTLCPTRDKAIQALRRPDISPIQTQSAPALAFLFPGQGAQYPQMLAQVYREEQVFRTSVQYCARFISAHLGYDLLQLLYPQQQASEQDAYNLQQTQIAQMAMFVVEYALAQLWMHWGVQPQATLGQSIGEYVAACLADVFSLDDALRLVAARGQLMQRMPPGVMLSVALSEEQCLPLLNEQLSLAVVNGPQRCVIAGPEQPIATLEQYLRTRSIQFRRLHTSHAFHSQMMEPVVSEFEAIVRRTPLKEPKLPFLSNVTGNWITATEATDPAYWARHLRAPVRFSAGVAQLLQRNYTLFLEIGPGTSLQQIVRPLIATTPKAIIFSSVSSVSQEGSDLDGILQALGDVWRHGQPINWNNFYAQERRRRLPLPTYPFERQRFWIEAPQYGSSCAMLIEQPTRKPSWDTTRQAQSSVSSFSNWELKAEEPSAKRSGRRERILAELHAIIYRLSGIQAGEEDLYATFFEKGFDSLFLLQVNEALHATFQIEIGFRQLFEELPSLATLAEYLDQHLPPDTFSSEQKTAPSPSNSSETRANPYVNSTQRQTASTGLEALRQQEFEQDEEAIQQLLQGQFRIMERQLDLLQEYLTHKQHAPAPSPPQPTIAPDGAAQENPLAGLYSPIDTGQISPFSEQQQHYLEHFIAAFTARTQQSKEYAQRHRQVLADPSVVATFRRYWKEISYPIVANGSQGSRITDLDGNEYIDLAMGFGVNLFGHRPAFLVQTLQEQLNRGFEIGPQSPLAGEVAELVCELTSKERAIFCNSGTEAVMIALRLARAVTQRHKIVIFAGAYHGSFDGVLARRGSHHAPQAVPLAPGTPPNIISDVIVLDYSEPAALETIRRHAHELAAVLVEPVQSRRPALQPREFLQTLRTITKEAGIALICDEIITGFRMHAGGAQALFGFQADIATYGKVVGGGIPIGIVAGKAQYMDALDGGWWSYGDDTFPQATQTFFAGTFCKHPFAMAAAKAVLTRIKAESPQLQEELGQATAILAQRLNTFFAQHDFPIEVVHFGSLFRFHFRREQQFSDLFFLQLLLKGIFVWSGRTCFLSTAHSVQDREEIIKAVQEAAMELRTGGFLQPAPRSQSSSGVRQLSLTPAQQQLWVMTQMGTHISCSYNEIQAFALEGTLELSVLELAFQQVIARHEALRTTFSALGDAQYIHPSMPLALSVSDYSSLPEHLWQEKLHAHIQQEQTTPFDLQRGPLMRVQLMCSTQYRYLLLLTIHHLVTDSWSFAIIIKEVATIYAAIRQGKSPSLPPPASYSAYVQDYRDLNKAAESYWRGRFPTGIAIVTLPYDYPRPAQKSYCGALCSREADTTLYQQSKAVSARYGSTLFIITLAAFTLLIHYLSEEDDLTLGIHISDQPTLSNPQLVGFCINLLPLRDSLLPNQSLMSYVTTLRQALLEGHQYRHYAFSQLATSSSTTGHSSILKVCFNLDSMPTTNGAQTTPDPADLTVTQFHDATHVTSSHWELSCNVIETGHKMVFEWCYDTDLFAAKTIQCWLELFEELLSLFIQSTPDTSTRTLLKQLGLIRQQQQQRIGKDIASGTVSTLKSARRRSLDK
ncbi:MAG TPA: aminotransferase class III-fold pyridoxal phosphate-dependent enzyme [Ktedonobacteraceae bacterium]|nr:aminotransferase class III-fold pyridoxal phosphate-dependent enzyme [Ktedonobacteraceae bacterium]